jgi:hypothetical protein
MQGEGGVTPVSAAALPDRPRRRSEVTFQPMPDGTAVLVDPASGAAYALNATGALVWQLCDGSRALDDIAAALAERFDVTPAQACHDIAAPVQTLRELDMLEPA